MSNDLDSQGRTSRPLRTNGKAMAALAIVGFAAFALIAFAAALTWGMP